MGENMKRNNKKKVVKTTKFSEIILNYRTERKLTQKQLGEIIGVSDRTISKWEKGDTEPDLYHVKKICKTLDIPPSNLVIYKKTMNDRLNKAYQLFSKICKFFTSNFLKILFAILFIFLALYFINNYNAIKIYNLKYESENVYFSNGYFYKTKTFNALSIENISLVKLDYEPTSYKVILYTYKNGDKEVLYQDNSLKNIHLEETVAANDLLKNDVIKGIKKGLVLVISVTNEDGQTEDYECKIFLKERFSSNKFFYTQFLDNEESTIDYPIYYKNISSTKTEVPTIKEIKSLEDLGYTYNKDNNTYIKIDKDGGKIEYVPHFETIEYRLIDAKDNFETVYNIKNNQNVFILKLKNGVLIEKEQYKTQNNRLILIKNQKNDNIEKVQYLLDIYKEVSSIL